MSEDIACSCGKDVTWSHKGPWTEINVVMLYKLCWREELQRLFLFYAVACPVFTSCLGVFVSSCSCDFLIQTEHDPPSFIRLWLQTWSQTSHNTNLLYLYRYLPNSIKVHLCKSIFVLCWAWKWKQTISTTKPCCSSFLLTKITVLSSLFVFSRTISQPKPNTCGTKSIFKAYV